MMRSGDTDLFLGDDTHIPHRCAYEFDMSVEDVRKFKVMRTVNGRAVAVGPSFGETLRVTVAATGWRRPSALRPGQIITLWLHGSATSYIPAGYRQIVLDRDPVPGSVRVVRSEGDSVEMPVAFAVAGRVVTVPQDAPADLTVFSSEIAEVIVESMTRGNKYGSGDGNWTLVCEELEPLS